MDNFGHGSQIVKITQSHSYELDEHELEQILLHDRIKDLPVVVVSVAGAYRSGKSFLLNFFLRYLMALPSAREDGSWLSVNNEPLSGFQWRNGVMRTTIGIIMWSEPFIATLPSGQKVAVLLIDTQGTFDSSSTVRDCSTIFALSTLVSSVQIYNLSQNIQEDDLQHLQLFTEYGKLVTDEGSSKPFQVLEFLVRDWQFEDDYAFGAAGGEKLLEERFKITPNIPKEMQELRQHIRSSFEKLSCFLMPHPGFAILKPDFNGNVSDLDIDFRTHLIDLVKSIFAPEKLMPKTINGEQIKAQDLLQYFKAYTTLFNGDMIPNPTNIFRATVNAGLLTAVNEAKLIYESGMDYDCGPNEVSVPADDVKELHQRYLTAAREAFIAKKKMGSKEEADIYLGKLTEDLEKRLPQFLQSNFAKIQIAIDNAREAYEKAIQHISKDDPLCVHPLDLEKVHQAGLDAAIRTFDSARKRLSRKRDIERNKFIETFTSRNQLLRMTNEQNNKLLISQLRMEYWQHMQEKAILDVPLYADEFQREHEHALQKALSALESRRNIASHYPNDIFKDELTTAISESFVYMKKINKSTSKLAINASVDAYDKYMKNAWNHNIQFLHPDDFESEHRTGVCQALKVLRPDKNCSDGFNYSDEDDVTLNEIIQQRYKEYKANNNFANATAVQACYNGYVSSLIDFCQPVWMWITILPMALVYLKRVRDHEPLKTKAVNDFLNKRRDSVTYYSTDQYKDQLVKMIDDFYSSNKCSENGGSALPVLKQVGEIVIGAIGQSFMGNE